jgi:hypothetical protein
MTPVKQILIFACIIVSVAAISGCTMSDEDVQSYIDSHPDEINAYVSSHGEMISSYLAEHPEILEAIELPEATQTLSIEPQTYEVEVTETQSSPTESPTVVIQSTTNPTETQTPTPTVTDTHEVTTVPTTEPTQVVTTTTIPTTEPTTIPTTEPTIEVTTEIPTTILTNEITTIQTTIPTTEPTPTPIPTQAPYLDSNGVLAIYGYPNGGWEDVQSIPNTPLRKASLFCITPEMNSGPNAPKNQGLTGTCTLSGVMSNTADDRYDDPNGPSLAFGFSFTWKDIGSGNYETSAIPNLNKDVVWSDEKSPRTLHVDPSTNTLTISGYEVDGISFTGVVLS